jgi:E3 ubiquitin-protein ligase DOA10
VTCRKNYMHCLICHLKGKETEIFKDDKPVSYPIDLVFTKL